MTAAALAGLAVLSTSLVANCAQVMGFPAPVVPRSDDVKVLRVNDDMSLRVEGEPSGVQETVMLVGVAWSQNPAKRAKARRLLTRKWSSGCEVVHEPRVSHRSGMRAVYIDCFAGMSRGGITITVDFGQWMIAGKLAKADPTVDFARKQTYLRRPKLFQ